MSNKPKAGLGGIVGGIIGVVIVGGIAATPFYLTSLESDDRSLRAAAQDDVEVIRRAVINLDDHLAAIADADAAIKESERLTPQAADEIKTAHPDVFGEGLTANINQTLQLLTQADSRDGQRGINRAREGASPSGPLNAGAAVTQMRREYFQANAKLQTEAKAAIDRLRAITRGQATAGGLLEVNRIQAMYYLAAGRMLANRGRLDQQLTSAGSSSILQKLAQKAQLRQDLAANQANDPTKALADIDQRIGKLEKEIADSEEKRSGVKNAVDKLAASIAEKEAAAATAWTKARDLEARLAKGGKDAETQYRKWTQNAREADAEAARLKGGLSAASRTPSDEEDDEAAEAPLAGGSLDALTVRLLTLEDEIKIRSDSRQLLETQREQLAEQGKESAKQRVALQGAIAECDGQLGDLLKQQDVRFDAGRTAYGEALKSFKLADDVTQTALRAAKTRTNNATAQARSSGATPDELQDMIAKDADTEAGLSCLAGEIGYARALANAKIIESLKSRALLNSLLAGGEGEKAAPADGEIQKFREEAGNRLADAAKSFEAAGKLLGGVNIKTTGATVVGNNYTWQCQVGLAAVHLLRASITELVDGSPDRESIDKAYDLLKGVAQGREQSPLISPALDTIQYLQRTAK